MNFSAEPILEMRGIGKRFPGVIANENVDFDVHRGEVLGIAGVSGNGQRELAEAISGLRKPRSGQVKIDRVAVSGCDPKTVRQEGLAYVPEERMRDGAIGEFNVMENLILLDHGEKGFCRNGFLRFSRIQRHCKKPAASSKKPIKKLCLGNFLRDTTID